MIFFGTIGSFEIDMIYGDLNHRANYVTLFVNFLLVFLEKTLYQFLIKTYPNQFIP